MPLDSEMRDILDGRELRPLHRALLDYVRTRMKRSREAIQKQYFWWDKAHEMYMHRRPWDKNDADAEKQGIPKKLVVPMTTSQIQTGVAFGYMLFTQRERFYEFNPTEDADRPMRECGEQLVHRDMLASDYKTRLFMSLLNVLRFGMAVEKDCWQVENAYVPISTGQTAMYQGQPTGEMTYTTKVEKVTKREGNQIRSISPYRFFPDPDFHPTDWQRGAFVATDEEYSREALETMEQEGDVVGTRFIEKYNRGSLGMFARDGARFVGIDKNAPWKSDVVCVTEIIIKLIPAEVKDHSGKALGEETMPHNWLIWLANDDRIIRAEPMRYLHAQYPLSVGYFLPDHHDTLLNSLAMTVGDLQDLISWLMNSRMAAVSRTVENQLIIDPTCVHVEDIVSRQRLVRMQKGAANKDARRFVLPVPTQDTTTGHVQDMNGLVGLMQLVTGVNDNMMGQYNGGRRSATEARATTTGAGARLKMIFDVLWTQMYQPQANRLLLNHRQYLSPEEFAIVCGDQAATYYPNFHADPRVLVRSYDYTAYDGTLPSEKIFLSQQLQELLTLLISNPMASAAFNIDPNKVLKEITTLRGLGTLTNFGFDQVPQNLIAALQMENASNQPAPTNGPPA